MTATDWTDLTFVGVLFAGLGLGVVVTLRVGKIITDYWRHERDRDGPTRRGDS